MVKTEMETENIQVKKKEISNKAEHNDHHDHDPEPKEHDHSHEQKSSAITPYILLLALRFHGFFEGMALGIQSDISNTLSLFLAIVAHKWAASLTLGI